MSARLFRVFAVFICTTFLSTQFARAVGEDVFVVPRVAVQAQADSATVAKRIAQNAGRRKAMDILLRRLTVEDDWAYLPTLETGEAAVAAATGSIAPDAGAMAALPAEPMFAAEPVFSDPNRRAPIALNGERLEELESGFEVYSEKSSANSYRAFITYRFKPDAVRRLLKQAQIPYSEAQTRPALIVPVLQTASSVYLWEDNNPWMGAWKVRPYDNELTPMIAPLGDLEDAAALSPRGALQINEEALARLAERYSVSQVIVAHAYLLQQDGVDKLRVRFINGYHESAAIESGLPVAGDAFVQSANAADVSSENERYQFFQTDIGGILAEAWFTQPSGNFPALAERAIEGAIAKYSKPWKEKTLIDHTVAAFLNLSAYYSSLSEWSRIRAALVSTPLVGAVQVRSLSRNGAEMLIQAFGDPDKLVVALEGQGLTLWSRNGEDWNIATPAVANTRQNYEGRSNRRSGFFDRGANDGYRAPSTTDRYGAQ